MVEAGDFHEASHRAEEERARAQLEKLFEKMPNQIPLFLFTEPGVNEPFNSGARQVIRLIREVTSQVTLREFGLDHALAKKWKATSSPTILFDPEHFQIRWLGAPVGEEAKTFVVALQMIGFRATELSEDSLRVLQKIREPRALKIFVTPTCPYCPQQAVNAFKAAIEKPELISLEIIDIQANPDLARKYGAQSVPQTFANEKRIAMGVQPEELFLYSVEKMEEQRVFIPESDAEEIEADLVIVGGGPAGLTAGIYAARSGIKAHVIEKGILGGQIATTPVVENYPGLTQVGGKSLVDIMVAHALQYLSIYPGEEVMEINPGDPIQVVTNRRRFKTKTILLATGAHYRHLDALGETEFSGRGVSYCSTCDGPLFKGKKVILVGGGNSAVTEALNLHNIGVEVTVVHRRDSLRAQDYLVKSLQTSGIPVLFNKAVQGIRGDQEVQEVELADTQTRQTSRLPVNGVFVAIGYDPEVELAKRLGVELTSEGYIKHDSKHRTNVQGIYAAGDVEGGYKQIVIAAGKGAEAAMTIFQDLMNPYWKKKKAGSRGQEG